MRIGALVACLLLCLCSRGVGGTGPVPLDVVFMDDALFFVLDEPREIGFLRVSSLVDPAKTGMKRLAPSNKKTVWLLGHDVSTPVKSRKHPRLGQIRYGRKLAEFPWVEGPLALEREVEYHVQIKMASKFADASFKISKDGAVTVSGRGADRPRTRSYKVATDENGEKTLVITPDPR